MGSSRVRAVSLLITRRLTKEVQVAPSPTVPEPEVDADADANADQRHGDRPGDPTERGAPSNPVDEETLLRFVEQFGLILQEAGIPRMPARVFAYVLADDAESYTAADLANGLRVSPAAISVAARSLVQMGLLGRERVPGSRSDHFRVYDDDVWSAITMQQLPLLRRNADFLAEGIKVLDPDRPGGQRVRETLEFYRFMHEEIPVMLDRWREYRRRHHLGVRPNGAVRTNDARGETDPS
jgi:DNA-binding transcriptional regulator GbsR (MarR family)